MGRLGPFAEGYRVWLFEAGSTPQTVREILSLKGDGYRLEGNELDARHTRAADLA